MSLSTLNKSKLSKMEVLLSCMSFEPTKLLEANIQSDVLVINQCDHTAFTEFQFKDKFNISHHARVLCIRQRGLSQSRNLAIDYALSDILLLADDDEVFVDNYPQLVLNAFEQNLDSDVLLFNITSNRSTHNLLNNTKIVGYIESMRACSQQIAFRREPILKKWIKFDVTMGAGTGNGAGEENRFLFDCLRHKLKIKCVPKLIAHVTHKESSWFKGYTEEYFINRGYSSRKLLGRFLGLIYIIEWSFAKRASYSSEISIKSAIFLQLKGLFFKP